MFMSIRRYRIGEGQRDEVIQMVDEGWTDHLRKEPPRDAPQARPVQAVIAKSAADTVHKICRQ